MAHQYEEEFQCWKRLEDNKSVVPADVWEVFDCLLTDKVKEIKEIFLKTNFNISRTNGVVIQGLIQSIGAFILTIRTAEKNEITKDGEITLIKDIHHLVGHCIRNDLNIINGISGSRLWFDENIENKKEPLEKALREIFEVLDRLKTLTKE